jgi:transcriptional antiterminator
VSFAERREIKMSNYYNSDVYLRLLTIISLLTETEEGMTINELSERLNVGQSTIINDLHNLQLIAEFNMSIGPADWDLKEYWEDKDAEVREEEDNEFLLALYEGTRNDVPLRILYLKRDEQFSVELTAFERIILSEYLKKHNMGDMMPD